MIRLAAVFVFSGMNANEEAIDFDTQIQPILAARCYECHGSDEQESGIRFDVPKDSFDESYPLIIAGDPDKSLLVERIEMPAEEEGRMPPIGETLSGEQIGRLRLWIEQGAPWPVSEDDESSTQLPPLGMIELTPLQRQKHEAAIRRLEELGAVALPVAQNTNAVSVNLSLLNETEQWSNLEILRGLESTLVWLNLTETGVTDESLGDLGEFHDLRRLSLAKTSIGDSSLEILGGLEDLQFLNVYGTQITDQGLAYLEPLAHLQNLYVWNTAVTAEGAAGLQETLPHLKIEFGLDVVQATSRQLGSLPVDYPNEIAPLLARSCYSCHGEELQKGGLRLDQRSIALAENSGVIVVGAPDASEMIRRVELPEGHADRMPKTGAALTKHDVALLRRWIAQGAPWTEPAD